MIFKLLDDVGGLGGKTSVTLRVNQAPITCRTLVTHLIDQRDYHPDALSFVLSVVSKPGRLIEQILSQQASIVSHLYPTHNVYDAHGSPSMYLFSIS